MFIDQSAESKIQIGGYDLEKYALPGQQLTWHDISAHRMFWAMPFHNVKLGDDPFPTKITEIMADTGTSLNMIPDADFNHILDKFGWNPSTNPKCKTMQNTLTAC